MLENQKIHIAVDAIVFGYHNNNLYALFVQQKFGQLKNSWVLPGGFVKSNETLQEAVTRELQEEAGLTINYLEQVYTFGDNIKRDPRGRVISVAYFALVNSQELILKADTDAKDAKWFPVNKIPALGFDHNFIFTTAFQRLKNKVLYQPVGFDLLPNEFLFSELENLYCVILEKDIDRRNFRKKILSFGSIEETDKISPQKSGRPARLFRFNKRKYHKLLKEGFHFEINFA